MKTNTINLGRIPGETYGYQKPLAVIVRAALEPFTETVSTIEHEQVEGGLRLSLTGEVRKTWPAGNDRTVSAGQIDRDTVKLLDPHLAEIWGRWHLNDMRAGCAHQTGRHAPPCAVSGYLWGHSWLYEPLPTEVVEYVTRRFALPS